MVAEEKTKGDTMCNSCNSNCMVGPRPLLPDKVCQLLPPLSDDALSSCLPFPGLEKEECEGE